MTMNKHYTIHIVIQSLVLINAIYKLIICYLTFSECFVISFNPPNNPEARIFINYIL